MPYNGEKVVVDGADPDRRLDALQNGANGPIYQAPMNWSLTTTGTGTENQVFVDGQMMNYARWPNTSLDVSRPDPGHGRHRLVHGRSSDTRASSRPPRLDGFAANYWDGATIHFEQLGKMDGDRHGDQFLAGIRDVHLFSQAAIYDPVGGRIPSTSTAVPGPGRGGGVVPGPDRPARSISGRRPATVRPTTRSRQRTAPMASNSAACRTSTSRESTFSLARSTPVPRRRTTRSTASRPFTSPASSRAAGQLDNWSLHMQDTGIIIQGSNNTLENSEIGYSAGNGVLLKGDNTSLSTGNVVTNNVIHDVDYMALDCGGVNTGGGGGNRGGLRRNLHLQHDQLQHDLQQRPRPDSSSATRLRLHRQQRPVQRHVADRRRRRHVRLRRRTAKPSTAATRTPSSPTTACTICRPRESESTSTTVRPITSWITTWSTTCPTALTLNLPSNNNLVYNNTLRGGVAEHRVVGP